MLKLFKKKAARKVARVIDILDVEMAVRRRIREQEEQQARARLAAMGIALGRHARTPVYGIGDRAW